LRRGQEGLAGRPPTPGISDC